MKRLINYPILFALLFVSVCVMYAPIISCQNKNNKTETDSDSVTRESVLSETADTLENESDDNEDTDSIYKRMREEEEAEKKELLDRLRNQWKTQTVNTDSEPTDSMFKKIFKEYYSFKDEDFRCLVWNRNNGHKLIPLFYGYEHGDGTIGFYDYNPKTRQLEVDTIFTDKFKDIEPSLYNKSGFSKYDFSSDYPAYTLYIWNGKDFTEYKSENEFLLNYWKPQKVKAVSRSGRPSVLDFMNTFTGYYGYQWEEDEFYKLDIRRGYCSVWSSDNVIECVIWNRNNKHVLICVSLITYFKYDCNCGPDSFQFLFYDYDPATKTMTAETQLTKRFRPYYEKAEIDYEYGSVIPIQGKDIKIDSTIFKWNGYDFNFPSKK